MISVDSLLYKIDQRLNKLSSNMHQQVHLEDKILALNEAQIALIKTKMDGQSVFNKIGLDGSKKRYEDIENLIVDYTQNELSLVKGNPDLNQWDADISKLHPKYMFYVDAYLLADKGVCKDRKISVNKDLIKHGDVQFFLSNVHYAPSFEYQETFSTITDKVLSIYTDGTFVPTAINVMYIRYPQYIDKAGYIHFDGKASVNRNCELKEYLEDELLDRTVLNLAMYSENMSAIQNAAVRIGASE